MSGVKPLNGLTKAVIIMLCIYVFVLACSILTSIFELIEYARYDADYYLEELLVSEAISALVGIVFLVIYIITAVCFLKWTYRANKNLSIQSDGRMTFSPSGSIVWYIIPVANLFKPYHAMREIWRKAHKTWTAETRLLPGWWTLWIISSILGQIVFRQNSEVVSEYRTAAITMIFSDVIDIVLGLTAIALISNIGRAYEENYCGAQQENLDLSEALGKPLNTSDVLKNLHGQNEN